MPSPADTRHLSLLVAIEDHGGLVAAAKQLHLTPSALSQQLRALEERLGGTLFRREWRRLVPTEAGRRMIIGARTVLDELARVEAETRQLLAGARAVIRVTVVCHQSYKWLSDVLEIFAAERPDVEVTVVAEAADAPAEWLARRKVDVALVSDDMARHPQLRVDPLFRDELVAVVGRRHPWFGERRIGAAAFAGEHVIADTGTLRPAGPFGRAMLEAGVAPRKVTLVPMAGSVSIDMTRANLGVTLLPRWTFESLRDAQVAAVRIGGRGLWLRWALATRAEEPEPALTAFLAAVRLGHPRARRSTKLPLVRG
ncbi:MAG: LysR family transcriptional regulator [Polyangiaceae bacterium]|nr:LysR family transcriptional regulator [Polyangiaceae bacterium]